MQQATSRRLRGVLGYQYRAHSKSQCQNVLDVPGTGAETHDSCIEEKHLVEGCGDLAFWCILMHSAHIRHTFAFGPLILILMSHWSALIAVDWPLLHFALSALWKGSWTLGYSQACWILKRNYFVQIIVLSQISFQTVPSEPKARKKYDSSTSALHTVNEHIFFGHAAHRQQLKKDLTPNIANVMHSIATGQRLSSSDSVRLSQSPARLTGKGLSRLLYMRWDVEL